MYIEHETKISVRSTWCKAVHTHRLYNLTHNNIEFSRYTPYGTPGVGA